MERLRATEGRLSELALGGTAVGTGLNTHPEFASRVIAAVSEETGLSFREAVNHFEAQAAQDAAVETSGALKSFCVSLGKIANDIRWLSSGPRCGLGEINIPSLQPGSSIMPGKVNPVIPEVVLQAVAQVIGSDVTISLAGQSGSFELNVMLPLIAYHLLKSIEVLGRGVSAFAEKCIAGISANRDRCAWNLEQSLALATALVPKIGYDRSAALAKEAYEEKLTIREAAIKKGMLPRAEVDRILDETMGKKGGI
jgi:fumarate hydratase class II